jgi:hypothetical protein
VISLSNQGLQRVSRIEFGRDHVRISPISREELRKLEPNDIYKLIRRLYENKPLFNQFSQNWRRKLAKVRLFNEDDFVPNEFLLQWVKFIETVLIPKEDGWQKEQDHIQHNRLRFSQEQALCLDLLDHNSYPAFMRRIEFLRQNFDAFNASEAAIKEALRWCDAHARIASSRVYEEFSQRNELKELHKQSYLALIDISRQISRFSRVKALCSQIRANPDSANILMFETEYQLSPGAELEDLSESELRRILKGLSQMRLAGLSYNSNGSLVARQKTCD